VFICRSGKNTYYNPSYPFLDVNKLPYSLSEVPNLHQMKSKLSELVLKTRARGLTIEGYFA